MALILVAAIIAGPACTRKLVKAAPGSDQTLKLEEYRIGPEDVLQISVWGDEAISRDVTVRPDGKISLPLVNDVQAAGRTPMELRNLLTKKLDDYLPDPEVSVIVLEVRSFKVSVVGEVPRPGQYEFQSSTTVVDVIALAGGFTLFADGSRIVVLRRNGRTTERIPFDYDEAVSAEGGQENFYLRNGDIVVVP